MGLPYFLLVVLGCAAVIFVLAVLVGYLYRDHAAPQEVPLEGEHGQVDVLGSKPTGSPQREAELRDSEVDQMLAAVNAHRRLRGAPERSLEELALYTTSLEL
jgi:hypothetical protein